MLCAASLFLSSKIQDNLLKLIRSKGLTQIKPFIVLGIEFLMNFCSVSQNRPEREKSLLKTVYLNTEQQHPAIWWVSKQSNHHRIADDTRKCSRRGKSDWYAPQNPENLVWSQSKWPGIPKGSARRNPQHQFGAKSKRPQQLETKVRSCVYSFLVEIFLSSVPKISA